MKKIDLVKQANNSPKDKPGGGVEYVEYIENP